jgi:hypothetical protein
MFNQLPQLIAQELRSRGNKSVKSIFANADIHTLSVFTRSHTPENPKSFNYQVPEAYTIPILADEIAAGAEAFEGEPLTNDEPVFRHRKLGE